MNYEQKYKGALDAAKHIYDDMKSGGNFGGMEDLEVIFPELRESEDERIRKFLVEILSHGTWRKEWPFEPNEVVAYLEKQKEPKVDIDKLRRDLYQSGYNDGYQHGKEDAQKEQKPAEWSEEEEKEENLSVEIERFYRSDEYKLAESIGRGFEAIARYFYELGKAEQKPVEWSEEDELMRDMALIDKDQLKAEIERLKKKNRPLIFACASQVSMEAGIKQETYNEILAILDSLQDHQVADEVMDNEEEYETLLRDISISTEGQDKVDKIIILWPTKKPSAKRLSGERMNGNRYLTKVMQYLRR